MTLLEKIEANAANRLPLPPNRKATQELARYKTFLKVESHRLQILHRAGGSGREVCRARATILDVLSRCLLDATVKNSPHFGSLQQLPIALVAIGGYGRAELSPHSDIDLMFLSGEEILSRDKPDGDLCGLTD